MCLVPHALFVIFHLVMTSYLIRLLNIFFLGIQDSKKGVAVIHPQRIILICLQMLRSFRMTFLCISSCIKSYSFSGATQSSLLTIFSTSNVPQLQVTHHNIYWVLMIIKCPKVPEITPIFIIMIQLLVQLLTLLWSHLIFLMTCQFALHKGNWSIDLLLTLAPYRTLSYHQLSPSRCAFAFAISSIKIPKNFQEALSHSGWQQAMIDNVTTSKSNHTWTLVPHPPWKYTDGYPWSLSLRDLTDRWTILLVN